MGLEDLRFAPEPVALDCSGTWLEDDAPLQLGFVRAASAFGEAFLEAPR